MFTKVVRNFCNTTDLVVDNYTKCDSFTSFPRDKCYPITYGIWTKLFEDRYKDEVLKKIDDAQAHFVHVWNKMQEFGKKIYKLPFTSDAAYINLAKTYCPKTFKTLEKYFRK
jgi:hypothetical protein